MKRFHLIILLLFFSLIATVNLSHANDNENIAKNAIVYYWGDVVVVNAHLERDYSIDEINSLSRRIKYDIYYHHNLKKFPVCVINYFFDKNKVNNKVNPWEVKGWEYQYVINKQMKREFLYATVNGVIKKIQ